MHKKDYSCRIFWINVLQLSVHNIEMSLARCLNWCNLNCVFGHFITNRWRPGRTWLIGFTFPQRAKHEGVVDKTHRIMMKSAHDAMGHRITQPRIYLAVDLRSCYCAVSHNIRLNHDHANHLFQTQIPTPVSMFRTTLLQNISRNTLRTPKRLESKIDGGAANDNESGLKISFK